MTAFTQKGFTIIEFSVIIVIIGILAAALFPNYNASQQKSRDVARVTSTDTLAKSLSVYFLDKEKYPSAVAGCIPDAIINKYNDGKSILDRVPTHDNGCGPNGNYGYGTGGNIAATGAGLDEFIILTRLEFPNIGNFTDTLVAVGGLTGTLTATGFTNAFNNRIRTSGNWLIKMN